MPKAKTGKRIKFELEFYWRGKNKTPSVNITYAGDGYGGLPDHINDKPFSAAAQALCKQLVDAGELD